MKCSYCNQEAHPKCTCKANDKFSNNLKNNFDSAKDPKLETPESSSLERIRKDILRIIMKITEAKNYLIAKSNNLIRIIEDQLKKSIEELDTISMYYSEFLKSEKSFKTVSIIEDFEFKDFMLAPQDFEYLENDITRVYGKNLIFRSKNLQPSTQQLINQQTGEFLNLHAGQFICGAIAGDGVTLVTGGRDSTIRYWDIKLKTQKHVLLGHNGPVRCLLLTEDSKKFISGSDDASIRVWDYNKRVQIAMLKGHLSPIFAICYIEKPSSIVSAGVKCDIIIWDFLKYTIRRKINRLGGIFSIYPLAKPSGFIVGSYPDIYIYDFETGNPIKVLKGHKNQVLCLALTTNKQIIVSGSADKTIILWDLVTSLKICQLYGHTAGINSLALTWDDKFIVSGSEDFTVRVWCMDTGIQIIGFNEHSYYVRTILRVNKIFLTLSEDSSIGVLDLEFGTLEVSWFLKPFFTSSLSFTPDKKLIAYGSMNEVYVWNEDTCLDQNVFDGHQGRVLFVDISRDGQYAISCSEGSDHNLIYWDLKANQKIQELNGHKNSVYCVAFSKNGSYAASGSGDNTVRTWRLRELMQNNEFQGHSSYPRSIKFLDQRSLLVSAGDDKKVIVWNLIDKTIYAVVSFHNFWIEKILVTEDERFIISADLFEGIRLWNVSEKRAEINFSYEESAKDWLRNNKIQLDLVKCFLKA